MVSVKLLMPAGTHRTVEHDIDGLHVVVFEVPGEYQLLYLITEGEQRWGDGVSIIALRAFATREGESDRVRVQLFYG